MQSVGRKLNKEIIREILKIKYKKINEKKLEKVFKKMGVSDNYNLETNFKNEEIFNIYDNIDYIKSATSYADGIRINYYDTKLNFLLIPASVGLKSVTVFSPRNDQKKDLRFYIKFFISFIFSLIILTILFFIYVYLPISIILSFVTIILLLVERKKIKRSRKWKVLLVIFGPLLPILKTFDIFAGTKSNEFFS